MSWASDKPCNACPWMSKDQRDRDAITPEVRAAAERGAWFCCHVRGGTCDGAALVSKAAARKVAA